MSQLNSDAIIIDTRESSDADAKITAAVPEGIWIASCDTVPLDGPTEDVTDQPAPRVQC